MAGKPLKAVPDAPTSPNQRATSTSFRIPVYWYNRVKEEADRHGVSLSQIYLRALTQYFGTFASESWETTDDPDVYDPTRFYTRSQDGKGHSVTLHVPIPKPLAGEISNLVQSGMVPAYRSPADLARDAIYHRTKHVAQMIDNGDLDVATNMAMLLAEELQLVDEAEQAEQLIDALRSNAQAMYAKDSSTTRLKRYLAQRREIADSIPEPYRQDYLSAIEDYEKRIEPATKKPARRRK